MAKRVLLVSAGFGDRMVLRDMLVSIGCQVVGEARTGEESVEKYVALKPDLVVMQASLPDVDGVIATREITRKDQDASVLICVGNGQRSLAMESLSAGAKDFVVKPLSTRKLSKAIKQMTRKAA